MARIRNSASGSSELAARRARPRAAGRSTPSGSLPQAERDRQRRRRVDLLGARHRLARAGDLDRLARQALGLGEDAVEHLELGQPGEDRRALRARLARDELDRPARRVHRAGRVAGRPPDVGQPLVEEARAGPGRAGRRARRSPTRGRRVAREVRPTAKAASDGADLEVDPVEPRAAGPSARAVPGRRPLGEGPARARAPPARRPPRDATAGDGGRLDRRARGPAAGRSAASQCQATAAGGPSRPSPAPRGGASGRSAGGRARRPGRSSSWRNAIGAVALDEEAVARAPRPGRPDRSASRTPSPVARPADRARRRAGSVSTSKAAATAASCSDVSGRSAGAMSRRTRRHSCDRIASRAMTSSSSEPVSEALGSSRRAASSSSATSGSPPDRSATSSSRLADARSPSIPSMRAASSSRSSGGERQPLGRPRRRPAIAARSADHGSSRGDDVGLVGRRRSPGAGRGRSGRGT